MRIITLTIVFISVFHSIGFAQPPPIDSLIRKFEIAKTYPSEQIYAHINKHLFAPGEDLWFKLYMVNPTSLEPGAISKLAYVELVDPSGQLIDQRKIHIVGGLGNGDLTLPDSLPSGKYLLRAYTRFMLNDGQPKGFVETIHVSDNPALVEKEAEPAAEIAIDFFPEGGNLVNNLPGRMAFKATLPNGLGAPVTGTLYDQNDNPLTSFESNQYGLGSFFFKPETGARYYVKIHYDSLTKTQFLPAALDTGYLLQVRPSPDAITVMVQSQNRFLTDCKLFFYTESEVLGFLTPQVSESHLVTTISTEKLPDGIIYFTLFDGQNIPQCERLVYVYPRSNDLQPAIQTGKQLYQQRERVRVKIAIPGDSSFASVGIVNKLVSHSGGHNIYSYLKLTSNLRGQVQNPWWYFEEQNKERYAALDYIMLTHGWRRFNWEKLTNKSASYDYSSEQGFTIAGQLLDFYNRNKPVQGKVTLSLLENPMYNVTVNTGPNGRFIFADNHFPDSVTVILQASKLNKRQSNNIFIQLNDQRMPFVPDSLQINPVFEILASEKSEDSAIQFLKDQNEKIATILEAFEGQTIILDEYAFTSKRTALDYQISTIYGEPSRKYVLDSLPGDPRTGASSMMQLMSNLNIPGLNVHTLTMRGISSLNADNTIMFLVDGVQIQPTEDERKENFLNFISPQEVARVDVLTGSEASMYGTRGANGVIAIYTKRGGSVSDKSKRMGIIDFTHPGYYQARSFYAPRYDAGKVGPEKPDFRHTLHWEPNLVTKENGEVAFDFYTSDEIGEYEIELQGITKDGEPFYRREMIWVE